MQYIPYSAIIITKPTSIMKNFKLNIFILLTIIIPSLSFAQSTFKIEGKTYYLHKLSQEDLSDNDPADAFWNQNMVADNKYIYIADHTDKYSVTSHLKIKVYDAITGHKADNDIIIPEKELYKFDIDLNFDDEHRCFYLVECNDDDHLILFLNTSYSGENAGVPSGDDFYFYLINKNGTIEKEFAANTTNLSFTIMDFGIPQLTGSPVEGNFEIIIPMVSENGRFSLIKYTYKDFTQSNLSTIVYNKVSPDALVGYSKPSVNIVDDNFIIVDDRNIAPSLYSHTSSSETLFGELSGNNISGLGCNIFDLNGHRILCSGDIFEGNTQINLGLWDSNNTNSDANSINFDSYSLLASLKFGPSTYKSKISPYAYRQFIAISDFGATVKHLHVYVPGEFLATYQINGQSIPTDVGYITEISQNQPIGYHISNKQIFFNHPIENVHIYNLMGNKIFQSTEPVNSINLTNFINGVYIIATPQQTIKILL